MATYGELKQRLDQNDGRYGWMFAGQSRLTRDIAAIDDIIASAQATMAESRAAKALTAEQREELVTEAQRQLELYRSERTLIAQTQREGGQEGIAGSILGTRANVLFHRYTRHFAGQSRSTRDVTMLNEMIRELKAIQSDMNAVYAKKPLDSVRDDLEVVRGWLERFETEIVAIQDAYNGSTAEEKGAALANRANGVFAQYRVGFAEKPRVSRRAELLVRLTEALGDIKQAMQQLHSEGLRDEHNHKNISVVDGRLTQWQDELTAIRTEVRQASVNQLAGHYGSAANAEFENYGKHFAGQNRATRDLSVLSEIIDRLEEIERQMHRLDLVHGRADNRKNLQIVRDHLVRFIAEYAEIEKAKAEGAPATVQ
jgi:hypothetical protein